MIYGLNYPIGTYCTGTQNANRTIISYDVPGELAKFVESLNVQMHGQHESKT